MNALPSSLYERASERVEESFEKVLKKLPADYRAAIVDKIRALGVNPWPAGKRAKKLKGQVAIAQYLAEYRLRIGPYRILYDVDRRQKKVILLKLVRRDKHTYG